MARSILGHTKWITRIAWVLAALLPNSLMANVDWVGDNANVVLDVQGWASWALVLVALWVPHPIALTAARMLAPITAILMTVRLSGTEWSPLPILAVLAALVTCVFIFTAEFGADQAQAGAFGNERRFLLRLPAPLALPLVIGWMLFALASIAAPLVVSSADWPIAIPVAVVALVVLWFTPQRLHQLSKRWLVRVPAGWVVHDAVLLADNILVRTHELQSMTMAASDTEAFDLTGITRGAAIEIQLRDSATVRLTPFATRLTKTLDVVHTKALLVSPTRARAPLGNPTQ